jgi:glycogen phosphorylase
MGAIGKKMVEWQHRLDQNWALFRFVAVKVETVGEQHHFEVQVVLGDVDPKALCVELYADGINESAPVRQELKHVRQLTDASHGHTYAGTVPTARAAADYTTRIVAHFEGIATPLECARMLWQRWSY